MTGLIMKLIICPLVVYLADVLSNEVNYAALYQPILVGLILAALAHTMEVFFLKKETIWLSTGLDFVAAAAVLYISGLVIPGATVTFIGAIVTALVLTATEIAQHLWLTKKDKTEKV